MGTTELFGRWGDLRVVAAPDGCMGGSFPADLSVRTETVDPVDPTGRTLHRARKLFADLADTLDREIDRLNTAAADERDESRIKTVNELIRQNQKALQTVLDIETKLAIEAAKEVPGRTVIDLEAARVEVFRRLARLAP